MNPTGTEPTPSTIEFRAPGPGQWETLRDHFPHALTPQYRAILGEAFTEGYRRPCHDYGLPVRTLELRFVQGRPYLRPMALFGGERPAPALPAAILRVVLRLVPAARRAARRAEVALAERRWIAENDRWYQELRPSWIERNRALQSVDPWTLDAATLATHLEAACANARAAYHLHFELHGADLLPSGILLGFGIDHGIAPATMLAALAGHSPATRLRDVDPEDLRWRSAGGYDLDGPTVAELGDLATNRPAVPAPEPVELSDEVRAAVPSERQAELDAWLADARATCGLRDDNSAILGSWTIGLLRRAMLAAGDALGFAERDLAVELTVAELVDALHELPDAPDEPVARARRDARAELSRHVAPRLLGPDEPLPPLAALPHAMAVFTRAFMLFRELNATVEHDDGLDGIGIGDHIATGRAVVADDATDALLRIEPGDILVTRMTTPAFNAALSCAGGLVVVEAGLVSHAAIMARELSLPTVLGVRDAMQIVDGACIHVDPLAGRVHVTDAPATPRG